MAGAWHGDGRPATGVHLLVPDGHLDLVATDSGIVAALVAHGPLPVTAAGGARARVRVRAGLGAALLGQPLRDLADHAVPLADVTGAWGAALDRRITGVPDGPRRQALLLDALAHRGAGLRPPDRSLVLACRSALRRGVTSVADLCEHVEVSERHLRRRLREQLGYGPMTWLRIARLERFLAAGAGWTGGPRRGPATERDLAVLAATVGYADQPHMTRDLRALTGSTPRILLRHVAAAVPASG